MVIIFPLCVLKKINELRYASLLSISSFGYIAVVVVLESYFYIKYYNMPNIHVKWFSTNVNDLFSSLIMVLFAFICHAGIFVILSELKSPTSDRMYKVAKESILLSLTFYSIISIFGYASTLNYTPEMITDRMPYKTGFTDIFMNAGRVVLYIAIIIHIPVNYHPFRRSLFNVIFKASQEIDWMRNVIVTVSSLLFSMVVAVKLPYISSVINIVTGYCGTLIAFITPSIFLI